MSITEYRQKKGQQNEKSLGTRYPSRRADYILLDLHNSSYHTKAESNNCYVIFQAPRYFKESQTIGEIISFAVGELNGQNIGRDVVFADCSPVISRYER